MPTDKAKARQNRDMLLAAQTLQTTQPELEAGWYKVTYRFTGKSEVAFLPVANGRHLIVIGQEKRIDTDRVIFNERIMDTKGNLLLTPRAT